MRTQYKNTTLGDKQISQVGATRRKGFEDWIVGGVIVASVTILIWLLSRL